MYKHPSLEKDPFTSDLIVSLVFLSLMVLTRSCLPACTCVFYGLTSSEA